MSSFRSFRQRLNKFEHEHFSKDSNNAEKSEQSSVISADIEATDPPEELNNGSSPKGQNCDEKKVFEEQLNQLQEHLMIVMIENRNLKSDLKSSTNKLELEKLKILLEYERKRNEILERKSHEESKKIRAPAAGGGQYAAGGGQYAAGGGQYAAGGGQYAAGGSQERSISSTSSVFSDEEDSGGSSLVVTPPVRNSFYQALVEWLRNFVHTFLEDFSDEPVANNEGDPEGDDLSVKTLKENIRRFDAETEPYVNTVKGICSMLAWKSPPHTLIVFVVYMYSVWQGWFLPVLLLCITFRLFINFLRHRGWSISFHFFEAPEEPKDDDDKEEGIADKIHLVMQVARKVQNILGQAADNLEKVKSLLTWRHPEASGHLLLIIITALVISCFISTTALFLYAGLGLGIKLFIVDYIYGRFPRIRRKYDSHRRLWHELPTNNECQEQNIKSEIEKGISHVKEEISADTKSGHGSMDDRTFCELFSLPESEYPLSGWHGGRRCTLIRKDKSFTAAFKNGRLFLTPGFLCFERTKTPSPKNITIPLAEIVRIDKVKPFGWMPAGMSIAVSAVGNEKPYIFGAIINRDEIFEGILKAGRKAGLSWSSVSSIHD